MNVSCVVCNIKLLKFPFYFQLLQCSCRRRIMSVFGKSLCAYFFEETLKSKPYCSMLHDFMGLPEEDEITYCWLQQDGTTDHTANNSMKLLNETFRESVICRNLWPPSSTDLTPPDFYLCGAAQSAVCRDRPRKFNELKTAITAYIINISQADLKKVLLTFWHRNLAFKF
jgi:hypothetical protein